MSRRPLSLDSDFAIFGSPGDVTPRDLRFDPGNRAHLDTAPDGRLRFRVWTEPGITDATLVVRDRGVTGYPMNRIARGTRFDYWETETPAPGEDAAYSFAFRSPSNTPVYLAPSGISNAIERLDRWPLTAPPPFDVPAWAQGVCIYQIFPDRFANGEPAINPADTDDWASTPHPLRFQGGDLVGVKQRLGYLADLGVQLLYLNPIFVSPSNHRYDTIDYLNVDPALGGNDALRALVDEAHGRGIRIMLDASLNHCHPGFFAFQDVVRRGRRSRYRDWFLVEDYPVRLRVRKGAMRTRPNQAYWVSVWERQTYVPVEHLDGPGPALEPSYDTWCGVPTMPRIDLAHPEARRYMLDVAAHWVREYDIDGWRMDVARYVDHDFWNDFRRVLRDVRPDVFLLAEIMGDASPWLQGERFDATMNYSFRDLCLRYFARDDIDGPECLDRAARLIAQYAWPVTLANQNLIGSHDTPRFATEAGGEPWRSRLATVFQLTFPGSPGIYYGDELGLTGGPDPGPRGAFPWESDPAAHPLHTTIRGLTRLRRRCAPLVRGDWRPVEGRRRMIAFERRARGSRVLVVLNSGARTATLDVCHERARLLWGDGELTGSQLTVPARSAAIVRQ